MPLAYFLVCTWSFRGGKNFLVLAYVHFSTHSSAATNSLVEHVWTRTMSVAVRVMCSDGLQNGERSSPPGSRGKALSLKGRTAQIINGKLVLVEAGANGNDNILQGDTTPSSVLVQPVSAAPEEQVEETPVASTSRASTSSANGKASSIRPKLPRRQTRYFCTWEGCVKSYAKPVRLEEHLRSHTGERPYICTHEGCGASYLRDTHLVAHVRTHLDEKDKPFTCEEDGCGKKFWTNQHLNRHVKLVHEQNSGAYKVALPVLCIERKCH